MRKWFSALVFVVLATTTSARADDPHSVFVAGGDVKIGESARVVIVKSLSTIHLPSASEGRPAVLVTLLGDGGVGTRIVVDGQSVQGLPYLELGSPNASALLHPVDGFGYVQ